MSPKKASPHNIIIAALLLLCIGSESRAQTTTPPAPPETKANETITLAPFQVSTSRDYGYRKASSSTTSRIGADVLTIPQAVEIISAELLSDLSITEFNQVFRYSSTVLVGEGEVGQPTVSVLRGFSTPVYYNGVSLAASFGIQPFLPTDNLDRVEIAKGPVGLFYGNSSPNGVVNYITKRPQFKNASSLELSAGNFNYQKAVLDTQAVISQDLGLAYRLIASAHQREGRVDFKGRDYTFLASSFILRPNQIIELSGELDWQRAHNPYPDNASAWSFALNPQYFADRNNPSQAILDFIKTRYGAADDAAARAVIQTRWAPTGLINGGTGNWQADMLAMTGTQPFAQVGEKIEWWRYSPRGNKFSAASEESNFNGRTISADVGLTVTPMHGFSVKYRWLHQDMAQDFVRDLYNPNGVFRPDGRIDTLNAQVVSIVPNGNRSAKSDTQQLDLFFEKEAFNMRHQLIAGAELKRTLGIQLAAPIDYSKAAPRLDRNGNTQVGQPVFFFWDPFFQAPPDVFSIQSGSWNGVTTRALGKAEEYYVTYRGSALENRLNVLLGGRHVKDKVTRRKDDTYTIGAIYQFTPGVHAFASLSKTVLLTNANSVQGAGALPGEGRLLDNENGNGVEIGFKSSWRQDEVSGTVSYFDDEREGIVTADFSGNLVEPRNVDTNPNNDVRLFLNGGLHRVRGIDGDFIWTPNRQFQLIANFQYLIEAQVVSDPSLNRAIRTAAVQRAFEYPLAKSPKWRSNLVGKYTFADGMLKNLSLGAAVRHTEMSYVSNAAILIYAPAETLFDAFATYRTKLFSQPTELQVNLVNIGDTVNDITRDNGFEARFTLRLSF